MARIGFLPVDPVNLSIKGKLLSAFSCFTAILAIAWIAELTDHDPASPLLVASMGASAVLVFFIPNSPLSQPWPLFGGQIVSAAVGVVCAQWLSEPSLASACAVGGSVLAMLLLRCLHPPGAATALAPVLGNHASTAIGFGFILFPVGLNITILLALAVIINRWWIRHEYPIITKPSTAQDGIRHKSPAQSSISSGISEQEIEQAIKHRDLFVDVSSKDLHELLSDLQKHKFEQASGEITCADIMVHDLTSLEYGLEVEEAWTLMQSKRLKALPVLDKSQRVIGMVTWHDFIKFINDDNNRTFRDRFRAFIRRTPDVSTHKPESVGHIMSAPACTVRENIHISELISLMTQGGFRQIPVVDLENRLVGMAYQDNLISALCSVFNNSSSNSARLLREKRD